MSDRDEFEALKPCPFCGAGQTTIHVNKGTWNGSGYGEPVSVEVRHWCDEAKGQPSRLIARVGRDEASAIAAWNRRATPKQAVPALTAKQRYDAFMEPGEEPSPIERLRFFCSLAMSGQDWLDVEPFFDDLLAASQPSPEPKGPEHAHDWRFSLQDHVYKCDCGATRGDYPFGAASFKD